jgi:preprotein translocase subunit YajC
LSIPESLAAVATFIAQTTGPTTRQARPQWTDLLTSPIVPLVLVMVVFLVFSSRTRRRQEKAKQDMLGAMKRGDRVQTIGGILGNVVEVREDRVLLKVDEGNNTKVWFARSAIARVIGDEPEAK